MGEKWFFQLFDQVYPDQCDIKTTNNSAGTQTSIEIRLTKQQARNPWPQINTFSTIPQVPTRNSFGANNAIPFDSNPIDKTVDTQIADVYLKNFKTQIIETEERLILCLYVKEVSELKVLFTETNFTATFRTR